HAFLHACAMRERAFASAPFFVSWMQLAVVPAYGAKQSVNGPPALRCPFRHFCTHSTFVLTNLESDCAVPDSHLSSALSGGAGSSLGCACAWRTIEVTFLLDAQLGTLIDADSPPRDVFSRRIAASGGSDAGMKTSIAVMKGSAK